MDRGSRFAVCALAGTICFILLLRSAELHGQDQSAPAPPHPLVARMTVLLDPGHGGSDPGADLGNKVTEKDVTLSLATKLRTALAAQGFGVELTRDAGAIDAIPSGQRAATANRSHAMACISLHATRSGSGVHVYTSALPPPTENQDTALLPVHWDTAQEQFVNQSIRLADAMKVAFGPAGLPVTIGVATVPPLDNMMCPAVAVEFAPLNTLNASGKGAEDAGYQDSAVRAVTAALVKLRTSESAAPASEKGTQ